jgi:hypothetical protein
MLFLHLVIHDEANCALSLKNLFLKFKLWPTSFSLLEDRLTIKNMPHLINMMLSNLNELQTVTLLHGRIFKKMHIQHKWKSLAKAHGNTHLIKSLTPILDYFQLALLVCDSGRLYVELGMLKTILAKHTSEILSN